MTVPDPADHLSRISTLWTMVASAHGGDPERMRIARERFLERYSAAVYRYLLKVLGDAEAADEAFQELAVKVLEGGFRHADPQRGRFRDYLKTTVLNLVRQSRRRGARSPRLQAELDSCVEHQAAAFDPADADLDRTFLESCRDEFLERVWLRLAEEQQQSGQPIHAVLDLRARDPALKSQQLMERLKSLGFTSGTASAAAVRKLLERARRRFAALLIEEVEQTLNGRPTREAMEAELLDLGLLQYCRSALEERYPIFRGSP